MVTFLTHFATKGKKKDFRVLLLVCCFQTSFWEWFWEQFCGFFDVSAMSVCVVSCSFAVLIATWKNLVWTAPACTDRICDLPRNTMFLCVRHCFFMLFLGWPFFSNSVRFGAHFGGLWAPFCVLLAHFRALDGHFVDLFVALGGICFLIGFSMILWTPQGRF